MAVLGSGAGAGSAGQYAGEDNRGPGRCDSVGRLGSLVDGSAQVMGQHLDGQPCAVGGEAARGEMVEADAVLEVSDGILVDVIRR